MISSIVVLRDLVIRGTLAGDVERILVGKKSVNDVLVFGVSLSFRIKNV